MFLTLLIFCVGSVCATEPNNTTIKGDNTVNLTDNQNVINIVTQALEKKDVEIKALQDNDIKQSNEIQQLKENNTQLNKRIKALEDSNKVLTDSNKVLTDKVQALEYSKLTQSNRIKSLEIDIQNLEDSNKQLINSNKVLNNTVNNQTVKINELNNKLELQINEIKQLQSDKDKLNAEINKLKDEKCSIYEKLLESPKKEDYEQLKKDIADKDNKIKELNNKIKILNNILNINKKDVVNSLKGLSSTNIQNIKCGKYSFKLDDYLKIPLIKDGKNNVLKFKKDNGRLPQYVTIAGHKVPQKVYKKLYNL